jgi:hypothetical protein
MVKLETEEPELLCRSRCLQVMVQNTMVSNVGSCISTHGFGSDDIPGTVPRTFRALLRSLCTLSSLGFDYASSSLRSSK